MSEQNTAIVPSQNGVTAPAIRENFTREQLDLIKRTVAAGTSDLEFALFIEVATTLGLSPLVRQVYAIMRNEKGPDGTSRKKMTIQTGIDGLRLIAARTGEMAGIDDAEYDTEDAPHPKWARVTVYRFVKGQRVPYTAKVRWSEFGSTSGLWSRMPYHMLAKVAQSHALRMAFPQETSGIYTHEEMAQANGDSPIWATQEQVNQIIKACGRLEIDAPTPDEFTQMTFDEAEAIKADLKRQYEVRKAEGEANNA